MKSHCTSALEKTVTNQPLETVKCNNITFEIIVKAIKNILIAATRVHVCPATCYNNFHSYHCSPNTKGRYRAQLETFLISVTK